MDNDAFANHGITDVWPVVHSKVLCTRQSGEDERLVFIAALMVFKLNSICRMLLRLCLIASLSLAFLAKQVHCKVAHTGCGSNLQVTMAALSGCVGILYMLIAYLFNATFFLRDPTGRSLTGRPHSNMPQLQLAVKTTLALCFIFFSRYTLVLSILAFVCILTQTYVQAQVRAAGLFFPRDFDGEDQILMKTLCSSCLF